MKRVLGYYGVLIILILSLLWLIIGEKKPERHNPWNVALFMPSEAGSYQVSSYDTTGGNNDRINIHDGDTAILANINGPAIINRIWITIDSRDPWFLRRIILRIFWDDEKFPSVEVPVGDFFGTGFGYRQYSSLCAGMTSGGYFFCLPMPFRKSARIEAVNETGQEVYAFYYHIGYSRVKSLPRGSWYFHACWNRDARTDTPGNYTLLSAEGNGCVVGVNMSMQSYDRSLAFLEGDEMIYIDGQSRPAIHGTGTEDYFTAGWYFNRGEFAAPFHGLIMKDDSAGKIAAYRFHVPDPVYFNDSIHFTIEHGHANTVVADYSSTVYWYQSEPHRPFPAILPAAMRIPLRAIVPPGGLEAENLDVHCTNGNASVMDMSWAGAEWSNNQQLLHAGGGPFSLIIPRLEENAYDIDIYYTTGKNYVNTDVYYRGRIVGTLLSDGHEVIPSGYLRLTGILTIHDSIILEFIPRCMAIADTAARTGIDALHLTPVRKYIPEWLIIGPFPNNRESDNLRYGLDTPFPPEREISPDKSYTGAGGMTVQWKKYSTPEDGYFSLWDKVVPYEFVVCYAATSIFSPTDQTVVFYLGSDDGSKVFLNGKEIFRFLDVRIAEPDQDKIILDLKKGWNNLLLKIENNFGGYAFYARIIDKNQNLIFNVTPSIQ